MAEPEVSAVVVTHDAAPWIERSLDSLRGTDAEVIVVDNASADGTPDLVRKKFPESRLIEQENRGFGAGNNVGMRVGSGRYAEAHRHRLPASGARAGVWLRISVPGRR